MTGAARGLGRAYVDYLAARGATVVVNDLDADRAGVVEAVVASGGVAIANGANVATEDGARRLVDDALQAYGHIDVVVNNAGISRPRAFQDMTYDDLKQMMDVHLGGHFNVTRAAWPHLLAADQGRVVMTSSNAALYGMPSHAHYAAAKGAILGLTRSLAQEAAATRVRVNAIAPGAFTRMAEASILDESHLRRMRRHMPAEKVAPVVAWLSHPSCDVNGAIFDARAGVVSAAFVGQTQGFFDPELSIEAVADHAAEILDRTGYRTPATTVEAAIWMLARADIASALDE